MADRGSPQSFELTAGESFTLAFTADASIVGATVRFWAVGDADFSVHPGMTMLSTAASPATAVGTVTTSPEFTITIEDEDTEALQGTYRFETELEDLSGNKSKAAYGFLTFEPQVEQ
jgi:hypothetical protein